MGDFRFWPTALAGFDLLRRQPLGTLGLALAGAAFSFGARLLAIASTHFQVVRTPSSLPINTILLIFSLSIIALLVVIAAFIGAAVMRALSSDGPVTPRLRLGGDEARLVVLSLLLAPGVVIMLTGVAFGAIVGFFIKASEAGKDGVMTGGFAVAVVVALALASRLSLAGPIAVRDGGLRLKTSWRMTQARRWKIFGVFLVAVALGLGVGLFGILALQKAASSLGAAEPAYGPSLKMDLLIAFQPRQITYMLVQGLLVGLGVILYTAPTAALYRELIGERGASQAAVFD